MFYENYYGGMNLIWWFVWMMLLVWIFAIPYEFPFSAKAKTHRSTFCKSGLPRAK